jgi:hypothetical protein
MTRRTLLIGLCVAVLAALAFVPEHPPVAAADPNPDPLDSAAASLASWWPADGHAFDLAGRLHGERAESVGYVKGTRGGAFSLPGGFAHVGVPAASGVAQTFTIAVWVKPEEGRGQMDGRYAGVRDQRYVIFPPHGGEDGTKAGCGLSVGTNGVGVFEHAHDNCPQVLGHYTSNSKEWRHVAVVYDDGLPTLYVNGKEVNKGRRSPWTVFPGTTFGDSSTGYGPFSGLIDEAMLFDRALTGAEVKAVHGLGRAGDQKSDPLTDAAFKEAWDAISGESAPRALTAVHRLASGGDDAVKRLRERLVPAPADGKPTVEELIAHLDDDHFEKRESATRMLLEQGAAVVPKLRAALKEPPSPEARKRLESLLRRFEDPAPTPEQIRAVRAITALARIGTPASRKLLEELAQGPEAAPRTVAAKGALALTAPGK